MVAFGGKLLLAMYGSHSGASRLFAVWRLSAFWRVRYGGSTVAIQLQECACNDRCACLARFFGSCPVRACVRVLACA